MGAESKLSHIYDFSTLGVGQSLGEIKSLGDALERNIKLKQELNKIKDSSSDPATVRKVTTEIEKQATAHKNNVVKMNTAVTTGLKLASVNKELKLEIIQVVDKIEGATNALSAQNKTEIAAIQAAGSYSKASKLLSNEIKNTTKSTQDLTKATQEEKIIAANAMNLLKARIREELNAKGSLENRRAALIRLTDAYAKLSPLERETGWGKRLEATVLGVSNQVKVLEGNVGNSTRKVGSYTEGVLGAFQKSYSGLRVLANLLPGLGIAGIVELAIVAVAELADTMGILSSETAKATTYLEQLKTAFEEIDNQIIESGKYIDRQTSLLIARAKSRGASVQELSGIERKALNEKVELLNQEIVKENESLSNYRRVLSLKEAGSTAIKESVEDINKAINEGDKRVGELQQQRADLQVQIELNKYGVIEKLNDSANKKSIAAAKRQAIEERKLAGIEAKNDEAAKKIEFEAFLTTLDEHAREIAVRTAKFEEEKKVLIKAGRTDFKALEIAFQLDLQKIRLNFQNAELAEIDKFREEQRKKQSLADEAEIAEAEKDAAESLANETAVLKAFEDAELESQERQRKAREKAAADKKKFEEEIASEALDFAREYNRQQSQIKQQEIETQFEGAKSFLQTEKEKRLAQAQSAAEKQSIEEEFAAKEKELERQKNIDRQEVVRKQLAVEFALASIKAISTSSNIYDGLIKEGVVLGQYLLALNALNSQKFEEGGQVPTSTGGDITGPSHAAGGVPFGFEAEGGEMAIINKNSTMDKGTYNLTGTPRQIASAINTIGGGVQFAPGAITRKFEYGGLLGSNLSAPVFRGYYQNSTGNSQSEVGLEALRAITAMNYRIDNLQVVLNPHSVTKAQNDYSKQTQVGIV